MFFLGVTQRTNNLTVIRALVSLISLELILVLFLMVGSVGNLTLWHLPITLSDFMLGISLTMFIPALYRSSFLKNKSTILSSLWKKTIWFNLIILVFFIWTLLSLIWSPSRDYALSKVSDLARTTFWPFFAITILVAKDRVRVHRFIDSLVLLSLGVATLAIIQWVIKGGGWTDLGLFGGTYLGISRIIGFGIVIAMVGLIWARGFIRISFHIILFTIGFASLVISGSRTPLIVCALLIPVVFFFALSVNTPLLRKHIEYRLSIFLGIFVIFIFLTPVWVGYLSHHGIELKTLARLAVLSEASGGDSILVRINWYEESLRLIKAAPMLGYGIGSWPVKFGLGDQTNYPHNILIEILAELGVVGMIFFASIVVFSSRHFGRFQESPTRMVFLLLCLYSFGNALVSGDLADNRWIIVSLAFSTMVESDHDIK